MRRFPLAKVCWLERAAFTAVKFVTDGADHASGEDWQRNLKRAADRFLALHQQLFDEP